MSRSLGDDAMTRHELYVALLEVLEDRLENLVIAANPHVVEAITRLIIEAVRDAQTGRRTPADDTQETT
jgi:hypothetical protein